MEPRASWRPGDGIALAARGDGGFRNYEGEGRNGAALKRPAPVAHVNAMIFDGEMPRASLMRWLPSTPHLFGDFRYEAQLGYLLIGRQ
jgi:hypothetical protein